MKKGNEVGIMSTVKPIQATPVLRGKDAENIILQANMKPSKKAMEKNRMLHNVLTNIRKP
jgi:hypothetical protein